MLNKTYTKTTYTKITAKIMVTTLIFALVIAFIYGEYLKSESIKNLSKEDAKQTSMLIFESLYSAMAKGWNKEELSGIIDRLNNVNNQLKINVYRSQIVERNFGKIDSNIEIKENNHDISRSLKGQEVLNILENHIEYFYPIVAKNTCIQCHTQAQSGDVLGVIHINYPVTDLKVSLSKMINFFIYFILSFSIFLFLILFLEFDKYLLKPIKNFVRVINNISNSHDITKRINDIDSVEEISSMQNVFNNMLDSIEFQFYNDDLTKLPNRRKMIEIIDKKDYSILILLNIDNFQEINDLYGHEEGDIIIKEFAEFLESQMVDKSTLYKLNADEYGILFSGNFDQRFFREYTQKLIEDVSKTKFEVDNGKSNIFISCTIGIAYGNHSLLTNADIALKLAKKRKVHYLIYEPSMQVEHEYEQNLKWTKKIKDAISNDKIIPLFQPIVDCNSGKIVKYEALMRMVDDKDEYISPTNFLSLAKKNKLYSALTKIMIRKTFEIFKNRAEMISINLSVEDMLNIEIASLIKEQLELTNIGERVVFEIIESEGIENFESVVEFIDEVKQYGSKVSIDDFGTGYSNFEYLMKLKIDYIKIDASMIKNIDINKESAIITETIVEFANKLHIKTIAEFVYSQSIYEKVIALGIDYAQGYYFGQPIDLIEKK